MKTHHAIKLARDHTNIEMDAERLNLIYINLPTVQ